MLPLRVWVHCPRASNGLLPPRSNLVGYMRWHARSDSAFIPPSDNPSNSFQFANGLLFPYRIGEELPTKHPLCETWARMSHPDPNGPPDRRPIKVGEVWENPVTGERSVILERPWDNPASRVTGELTALVGACDGEHRHPCPSPKSSP